MALLKSDDRGIADWDWFEGEDGPVASKKLSPLETVITAGFGLFVCGALLYIGFAWLL